MNYTTLKNVCLNITDGEHNTVIDDEDGSYFLLSSKNIKNGSINITEADRRISEATAKKLNKRTKMKTGDIVISTVGTIGGSAIVGENTNFEFQRSVGILKPNPEKIIPEFLHYLTKKQSFLREAKKYTTGSVQECLFIGGLEKIKIPIYSIKEQQLIIDQIKPLENQLKINDDMISNLKEYSQLIFHKWFVDINFPDEDGNPYSDFRKLKHRNIPDSWMLGPITKLGYLVSGGTPSSTIGEYYSENAVPWLTPKDLSDNPEMYTERGSRDITELGLKKSSATLMPARSVLMSSRAPIGYLTISKNSISTNQGFKSIVPYDERYAEFIYFSLKKNMKKILLCSSGSTFAEVTKSMMEKIEMVIPYIAIIIKFNETLKPLFERIEAITIEQKKLKEMRDLLIEKLIR